MSSLLNLKNYSTKLCKLLYWTPCANFTSYYIITQAGRHSPSALHAVIQPYPQKTSVSLIAI